MSALGVHDVEALQSAAEVLAELHHDVGKYIVRVARNVTPGMPVPQALVAMLVKDLYQTHAGRPASRRFEELRARLPTPLATMPALTEAHAGLRRLDDAEQAVRAADATALVSALLEARAIETHLASALREVRDALKEGP